MMVASPVRFQKLVLATLFAAIATLAVADWRIFVSSPAAEMAEPLAQRAAPKPRPVPPKEQPSAIDSTDAKSHEAILERPLFDSSRRPPPPVAVKPTPAPPKPVQAPFPADKYQLVGIMHHPGSPPQALVRTSSGEPGLWIAEGSMVGDWRVEQVGEDRVSFSSNGASGVLKLVAVQATPLATSRPPAPATAAAPTPAPAPAPAPAASPAAK